MGGWLQPYSKTTTATTLLGDWSVGLGTGPRFYVRRIRGFPERQPSETLSPPSSPTHATRDQFGRRESMGWLSVLPDSLSGVETWVTRIFVSSRLSLPPYHK